jgi:protein O-GlcNAc transferase
MGIFDRFRATAPTGTTGGKPEVSEQDATRLIDEGHALEAQGRLDEAMQCYLEAIRLASNPARAHLNRGNVLLLKGDLQGALDAFTTAIKHKPDYAGAFYNIGNALLGRKQFDDAVASYRSALEIEPDYAEVHCALGAALKQLGELDEAIACFQHALKIEPELSEARNNLGMVLQHYYNTGVQLLTTGKPQDAATNFCNALEIEPNLAEAHFNLGNALKGTGQNELAMASYQRAIEVKPDYADAHCNLGVALQELGKFKDAAAHYHRAIEVKPDYAAVHYNLGNALKDAGQLDKAVLSFRRALEINPDLVAAHNNQGLALQELGQLDHATESYRRALEIKPDFVDALDNLLLALNYTASHSPAQYLDQARQYGRVVAAMVGIRFSSWQCHTQPQRLRIGLVSGDIRKHSVGHFLEGLLTHTDPARIELIAYPTHHIEDELTTRIRPYFSAWHPLFGNNDEAAARLIHADGVHVLIDLSGHTGHNRLPLFAWKPAPVQVTWLGLPNTTGVAEIDYVLGDPHAIPMEFDDHFSESVWRMPESYLCLAVPDSSVTVAGLRARSNGYVTFGSFNNLTKMTDAVVAVWARILKAVPGSRLLLKTKQLSDPAVCLKTQQRFAACGIASERLILGGILASRDDHLAAYNNVDIALDTFP